MVRMLAKRAVGRCQKTGDFDSYTHPIYGLGYTD